MALGGIPLTFVPDGVIHVRLRDSFRGRMRQTRHWTRVNCQRYRRYGRSGLEVGQAWKENATDWLRLARRLPYVRSRRRFKGWGSRLGRQIGLLQGSLMYRVPPPVMPHERSFGSDHPTLEVPRSAGDRAGRLRRARRRRLGTVTRVRTENCIAALTFDDGPDPEYTPGLLRILEAHGAKATFFLIGERAERHPEIVQEIAAAGHAIGNHTYSHRALPGLTRGEQAWELERCGDALGEHATRLFRPPYGQQNEESYRAARRAGYEIVGWSVMSGDSRYEKADDIVARILERLAPGEIVLMHDSLHEPRDPPAADRSYALKAVDQVLSRVGSHMRFVTVPELMANGKVIRRPWLKPD